MDSECIPLCDALNQRAGLTTFESCCGHGRSKFIIFFVANKVEDLRPVLESMAGREQFWHLRVHCAANSGEIYFELSGPTNAAQLTQEFADSVVAWKRN